SVAQVMGVRLVPVEGSNVVFIESLGGIVLTFLLIGAILLLWSFMLNRQVATRTRSLETEIQERKQTDETLRQSEERFRSYFNLPLAGRAITSASTGWIDVNPTLCDMLGYTKDELLQMTWQELTHPDDLPADLVQFKRVMAGEMDGYTLEKRFIHKDGHSIATNLVVHCVRNPDRSADYFVALIQDISTRKQAEQALQESEQNYRLSELDLKEAQSIAHIGNWKWDVQKGEITWSDEMYRIFGINKHSYSGRLGDVIKNVIHPDDLHLVLPSNAANLANKPIEYRIILPDSAIRYIWAKSGTTIYDQDGKPTFLTGVAQDITERKLAEEVQRKSEEDLAEAQQIAQIGSWQWDMLSNKVSWSKEMYHVFDINPDTYDGKPESLLKKIYPDDIELFTNSMNSNLSNGSSPALEYRVVHKDGSIHTIFAIGKTEFDQAGKPIRSNGTVQDITERKLAEEALLQANERLSFAQISAKAGFWDWDMTTGLLKWSPEFLILFGLDPATTPTFDVWRSVTHPEDVKNAEERINDSIREHTLLDNDYRIVLPSGELRWINALGNTTHDEDGLPLRMSGICIDITERKQAEEALLKSTLRFRALLSQSPFNGVIYRLIRDEAGTIIDWEISDINELAAASIGLTVETAIGKRAVALFGQNVMAPYFEIARQVEASTQPQTFETYFESNQQYYLSSVFMVDTDYYANMAIDITRRKQAEEQQNKQLEELRRWQNITQGREDRILQLKSEINRLLVEAGKPPRFASLDGLNLKPPGSDE
ncbi:MAG: PAS domain-containing protein, partial [Chloroflexota bacterium]